VIAPNEHVDQLLFPTAEDFNLYARQVGRIDLKLCYCSTLGECWNYDGGAARPSEVQQPAARCPLDDADEFRDYENAEPAQPAPQQQENKS